MSTSLNYASITQTPVRLWPLAYGAGLIAAGAIIQIAGQLAPAVLQLFFAFTPRPPSLFVTSQVIAGLLDNAAILAAIPLLAAALPRVEAPAGRWKMFACLALAAAMLLIRAAGGAYTIAIFDGIHNTFFGQLTGVLGGLSIVFQLALLTASAIYLTHVGACLGRRPLGIVAACAVAPCVLYTLASLAYVVMIWLANHTGFSINMTFARIYYTSYALNLIWHFLVWLAIALFAAILALQKPR